MMFDNFNWINEGEIKIEENMTVLFILLLTSVLRDKPSKMSLP